MPSSSERIAARRKSNVHALAAFGLPETAVDSPYSVEHEGAGPNVFTIGYERRDGEELIGLLLDAGVDTLVDVRQRAMSRKPAFRGKALGLLCEEAGIKYVPMPSLGSNDELRDELRATADFKAFAKSFRKLADRTMTDSIDELIDLAQKNTIALFCYEKCHDECHRSILSDVLSERIDACVTAIT